MGKIKIIGLGAGELAQLPYGVYQLLRETPHLYLRTKEHPVVAELEQWGLSFETFDELYEASETFENVYAVIAERLLEQAAVADVVYAVPGHPLVAEDSVQLLLHNSKGTEVEVLGGKSFLDDFFQAVGIDPIEGFQLIDGLHFHPDDLALGSHLVIMQVFNQFVAGEVKLHLMEKYPDEHRVALVDAAGTRSEQVTWLPLYEMDRFEGVHNLLSVYVPPLARDEQTRSFATSQYYMDRIYEGDIWVQQQTHETLLPYLREECAEVEEAVEKEDTDNLIEELGDVLLQVLYHAAYAEHQGLFSMEDILDTLNRKLRRRHPHVFDGYEVETVEDIARMWQAIKEKEKENDHET